MILKTSIFVLLLSSFAFAGPLGYKEGRWLLKAKESYFSTKSNFDKNGVSKELPNSQSLTILTTSISATYDLYDTVSAFAIFDMVYGRSVGYDFSRTRFTPTDLKLGGDFLLLSTFADVVPEVMVTIPLVSISSTTDEMIPSEGTYEIRAGSYISKHFDWLSTYAYLGYASRGDGRSSLLPYELQFLKLFESFQVSFGIWGSESITDDENTSNPAARNSTTVRVNGSSLKFYAINPSVTEVGGSVGFGVGADMFARLGYSHTILGANTAYGDTFWASLSYSFGGSPRVYHRETKKHQEKIEEKKKKEFKPESYEEESVFDEAVQVLQKEEVGPAPAPPVNVETGPKAPVSVKLRAAKPDKKPKKKRLK